MELRKTYVIRLDGKDIHATLVRDGAGTVWIETPGGARIEDALVLDGGRTVSIRRGGRMYLIDLTPPGTAWSAALVNGRGGRVQVMDELAAAAEEQAHGPTGGLPELKADMPGLVVQIKAKVGQSVTLGEPLVILEAMKMQNELPSPGDGVVTEILVEPGQSVDSGTVLVRLRADGAE